MLKFYRFCLVNNSWFFLLLSSSTTTLGQATINLRVACCYSLLVSLHSLPTDSFFSLNWEWFLNKSGHFTSLFKSVQWLPSDVRVKTTILIMICKALPCLVPFSLQSHFLLHNPSLLLHLWPIPSNLKAFASVVPSIRNLLLLTLCYVSPVFLSAHMSFT